MIYNRITAEQAREYMQDYKNTEANIEIIYNKIEQASKNGKDCIYSANPNAEIFKTIDLHKKEFENNGFTVTVLGDCATIRWN